MFKGTESDNSMNRLKQILASRYGKGLELRPLTDVSDDEGSDGGSHSMKGLDLHIPLRVRDAFLGTAVVPSAGDLSSENKVQISQMVRMILEPTLYRDFLERREDNLRSLTEGDLAASNIRLFENHAWPDTAPAPLESPQLLSNLIYFYGHDAQRNRRAAFMLHEMTGRWAFAPFEDLRSSVSSTDDLVKLGALTLYISDVRALDPASQELLVEYLSVPRSSQCPLILIGGFADPDELTRDGVLSSAILAEIAVNSLELDRIPLKDKSLRDVLHLMFFSET